MSADNSQAQCPICYDVLDLNDTYALLCRHTFHDQCITKWLDDSSRQTCPCCRDTGHPKKTHEQVSQSQVNRSTAFLNHQRKEAARFSGNITSLNFDPLDFPYSRLLNELYLLPHEPFVCGLDEPILWICDATVCDLQ
ncbi:RING Zn-finger domain-containing protein [Aphelenchoides avenae]|nr:RING Zn-finger domain-containing protein [Aphelenchus avenae]